MDINTVSTAIIYSFMFGVCIYFVNKTINAFIDINRRKTMNKQYELFMDVDIEKTEEMIDKLIRKHLEEYVLKEIIVQQIEYINKDQVKTMVKEIDKSILISLSDLYIFYIKLLTKIESEDDVVRYIHHKTNEHVLNFVTDFNKTK